MHYSKSGNNDLDVSPKRRTPSWWKLLAIVLLMPIAAVAYVIYRVAMNPVLGGRPNGERLARMRQSPQWRDGRFVNPQPQWADFRSAWKRLLFGKTNPHGKPDAPVPTVRTDVAMLATAPASGLRVTWFGHSSSLIEIDGSRVLIDPLWGDRASPLSWFGAKRWYPPLAELESLRDIVDVVVISHEHFDHLDYAAIHAMRAWSTPFVVPLGVGAHLLRWGIPEARIREMDWWESVSIGGLDVVATPARHSSGRFSFGPRPLWAGFALIGARHRVWYSGDTGFHATLTDIGERLGPFDLTLIDAGQYDAFWPDAHQGPELAVEAHRRVRGKAMLPVHWALIKLAEHTWTEPVERVLAAARGHGIRVLTPRPGESIEPASAASARWWPDLPWRTADEAPLYGTEAGAASSRIRLGACADNGRE
ncbi:MBL fold metallo-hydrolase [Brenneria tiliae]|uniref:MBL fold metallo-hydrolase n=1 Tax=Brenneria tiliae TaxID=2914984 RepID=A0ABT0MRZ9_9GAMM|nr:MBL fold metallo-hydrolase [Brenneria tiliae]MCL2892628.1 MBL fold metallo-hydrolase [Brenneria tiliae]